MNTPPPVDDIPEAHREALLNPAAKPSRRRWLWLWLPLGLAAAAGIGTIQFLWPLATANVAEQALESSAEPLPGSALEAGSSGSAARGAVEPDTLLGHRRYPEADASTLVPFKSDGTVLLQPAAAEKLTSMVAQAKQDGVKLGVISGFRTFEDQNYLFFDVKAERGETPQVRADVSAPPGYSEHHTGYAVDFIDLTQPQTNLEPSFEQTPAFQWLRQNAAYYGFELSFPPDNPQALSYEPWHWRFVGDQESLETFYRSDYRSNQ
ncbi:D-alanyl-D-alanine carboxypeptidase family protein [Romeria aff. gracilis LEGE 07310]|uniref:D-alanyl-D-alanine carboxypeptidase family protein n=1 Tax=Vasconcelosia minhoensis LEGE 07310 TaxID=915328 RepID=A0A8J7AX10_9CYAN|nr:M15 family metallopeptidase [Romeria gracilis]MBE9080409.1 D-alanyl-D-alanine carboxypeptidase family protein [Romeria aff. gracilis LEGE 07310]